MWFMFGKIALLPKDFNLLPGGFITGGVNYEYE
jgi:hypothetical protein